MAIAKMLDTAGNWAWGPPMLILLCGTHLFLTFRLRFIQKYLARAIPPYRRLWVAAVMVGSVVSLPAVWSFADLANALMAVPNLISLIVLSPVLVAETRTHLWEIAEDKP